jgi:hypothetical protein
VFQWFLLQCTIKKLLLNQSFKNAFRNMEFGLASFTQILRRRNAGWHGEGIGFRPAASEIRSAGAVHAPCIA